ncbi:hypothetical protein [Candidatus Symbiopectobacterium sp. NZEC135]|uniref:hypothetical protein n=1 Tax=Candidatus Symbiopectobacterium sp. NZEC135 TaxID=2820471 RepID=UPI00222768CF|nr:hypothetical protein [Candidatus Symbiopectobacterium sp. NZEC135]MCW2480647.1 hypothetical protein [Candidatus Symbiopectobacterium sp. NZEC135]
MHYNTPPVKGTLYLELKTIPNKGNIVSISIAFSPNILPFTAKTEGNFSHFNPEFNVGDIYTGAVNVLANFDFSEHLPTSCTATIIEGSLQIRYYSFPESTELIGYLNSISDFMKTAPSNVCLPNVISNRMDIIWLENNVLP